MRNRARKYRTVVFDSLEDRVVMSTSAGSMTTAAGNTAMVSGHQGHQVNGVQRNQAIVRDMGNFYQTYSTQIPGLVQAVVAADNNVTQIQNSIGTGTPTTADSQKLADAQQAASSAYSTLYQTMFGLVNGLGVQLNHDLGSNSAGLVRTLITGLPSNFDGISFPTQGPSSGSLLATLNSVFFTDLANLQFVANLTVAEVYSLGHSGHQTFPNAQFATFYTQYEADVVPLVTTFNTAVQSGDTAAIQTAQTDIDNVTRTDVFNLANSLSTALGPKFDQAIEQTITGTPGPFTTTTTMTTPNQSMPGAPAFGSLLATLESLPYQFRGDATLITSIVQLYAFI